MNASACSGRGSGRDTRAPLGVHGGGRAPHARRRSGPDKEPGSPRSSFYRPGVHRASHGSKEAIGAGQGPASSPVPGAPGRRAASSPRAGAAGHAHEVFSDGPADGAGQAETSERSGRGRGRTVLCIHPLAGDARHLRGARARAGEDFSGRRFPTPSFPELRLVDRRGPGRQPARERRRDRPDPAPHAGGGSGRPPGAVRASLRRAHLLRAGGRRLP